jgi:hypothetical protein
MKLIAVTIDYETWHPVPAGKQIDWDRDVFQPCEKLLDLFDQEQVRLTLMAEMGEYFWLRERRRETAQRMEAQWVNAVQRGHDVQLHLHPCWLPELGADFQNGQWTWDWSKSKASDYPADLTSLISRCKESLLSLLRPVNPDYEVTSYRAGAYQAQPFKRLHDALVANQILCDSSVYFGGVSAERGYDYTLAVSDHQPYFASAYDPQLSSPPGERRIVELPVFTYAPGQRWFIDNTEGKEFADRFIRYLASQKNRVAATARQDPFTTITLRHDYFVLIGHTKSELQFPEILQNLRKLKGDARFQFVTLSEMSKSARRDLEEAGLELSTKNPVQQKQPAIPPDLTGPLYQSLIPLDRTRVLRLCDRGTSATQPISDLYPWMAEGPFPLSWTNDEGRGDHFHECISSSSKNYDCVIGHDCWNYFSNVDLFLAGVYQALVEGGVFVSALPVVHGKNSLVAGGFTWQAVPHEVRMRLENAGFSDITIKHIPRQKRKRFFGGVHQDGQFVGVRAWKRSSGTSSGLDRPIEAMSWVYRNLRPEQSSAGDDPVEIIKKGYGYCWGYAVVLGKLLQREDYPVKWLTMLAKHHPKGRGKERIDSHEVVVLDLNGGQIILDPMANTCIPYSLEQLLKKPELARQKANPDSRYRERHYELYDTKEWYGRIYKYALRRDINQRVWFWKKNRNFLQTL